jgi:hypothetical protein
MKSLKNVIPILVTNDRDGKLTSILKAMHLGDRIEIYEDIIEGAQIHLATLPVYLSEWNPDLDDQDDGSIETKESS